MTDWPDIPPPIATRFAKVERVVETGSTNADVLAEARTGAPEGVVLVTDHQTAGRGRQSRTWHDEPGSSLLVTVLVRPRPEIASLLPLVAGLAVVDGLLPLADDPGVVPAALGLKWPNDVLSPGPTGYRKVAGTLCESIADGGSMAVAVGTGVNLWWGGQPPAEVAGQAVSLAEAIGRRIDRDTALDRYLGAMEYWLQRLEDPAPAGRAAMLDRYRLHCVTLGQRVRFTAADGDFTGEATDVTDAGSLLLDDDDRGLVELHAGDAHHLPPAR
jgi:BirA family biotin operon repressor/biotin-[acetyl-CoA-carboxylase] ligase